MIYAKYAKISQMPADEIKPKIWQINVNGKWESLEKAVVSGYIPVKVNTRIKGTPEQNDLNELKRILNGKEYRITFDMSNNENEDNLENGENLDNDENQK